MANGLINHAEADPAHAMYLVESQVTPNRATATLTDVIGDAHR
jgi:hypothetical protein